MSKPTPSDLIPIETAGSNTGKGIYFLLVAAAREEIKLFRPSPEGFLECSTSYIKLFLDNGNEFAKNMPRIYSNHKVNGPIESTDSLYVSKSLAITLAGVKIKTDPRSKQTDLLIIGALLGLIKDKTDLSTNEDVIEALENWMPNTRGLKRRTLEDRFAKATRAINSVD